MCDIDETVLNGRLNEIEKASGKRPAGFVDFRKLMEDKPIDAISIANLNHHHTLQPIWAWQEGKDVHVEKPCSHDMFEAIQVEAMMKKYGRLVQHGTNSRSGIAREAIQTHERRCYRRCVYGALLATPGQCPLSLPQIA